jgi:GNAT superfamily N-acetyltransferase
VRVVAVAEEHLASLRALFESASSPCFCRYWHFTGNKNEWLDRCANRPEENAAELAAAIAGGRDDGGGVVAIEDGAVIGWMKLTWRSAVPKLRGLPVYRGLDLGDDGATLSVGCFLVHPAHRRRGVAEALLAGAEEVARARGARAIEGYPRRSSEPLHDEEAWQGPEAIFVARGFAHVAGEAPYPVYRKVLAG